MPEQLIGAVDEMNLQSVPTVFTSRVTKTGVNQLRFYLYRSVALLILCEPRKLIDSAAATGPESRSRYDESRIPSSSRAANMRE